MSMEQMDRLKVLIIGAGAAGMSCAATLAKEPDKFEVTLLERDPQPGGQAKAIAIDKTKFGADWVNIGAQGGPAVFAHTYSFFRQYGHEPRPATLQFAFGKGRDNFWTNAFPTPLLAEYAAEIRRFGELLTTVRKNRLLWHLPLKAFLRLYGFPEAFGNKIIYPATSMVFGMGNQGRDVPCGLFQGLFEDPDIKFCPYDMASMLPHGHTVYAYPNMSQFYADWADGLRARGVQLRFNTQVMRVVRRDRRGVVVETRRNDADHRIGDEEVANQGRTLSELYDRIVFCIPGDKAKALLGRLASWRERFVLGTTQWRKDLTVTHSDHAYFQRKFEVRFRDEICGVPRTEQDGQRIEAARGVAASGDGAADDAAGGESGFQPTYCTFSYHTRPEKMEVGYDCTRFQPQFRSSLGSEEGVAAGALPPFERHVFQSHFIDETLKGLWTVDLIDHDKIIEQTWWLQLSHRWQHFIRLVPFMKYINGRHNTFYAGSWTYTNLHEVAVISGTAAAYRLGARYDKIDDVADRIFAFFLKMSHGVRFKRE